MPGADARLWLIDRGIELGILPAGDDFGMGLNQWSPLGGGLLTEKYERDKIARPILA